MPSPFPGMNPYLEQPDAWQDFHNSFIPAIRDALSRQVSPHFFVKIEEQLFVHEPATEERLRIGRADVALSKAVTIEFGSEPAVATLDAPEQLDVETAFDIEKHNYLEIHDRQRRDVVAVIEVLSPSNKQPGADRDLYLAKRRNILRSPANFVEIDLLRGGPKMPTNKTPVCDYGILVSRSEDRPKVGHWPIMLRDRLPKIPVPLRDPIPLAWLDLQEILHTVYDRAYYKDYIYQGTPEPPLSGADRAWAEELVKHASQ